MTLSKQSQIETTLSQIEAALYGQPNMTPHHRLIVTRDGRLDSMEVQVEVSDSFFHQVGAEMLADQERESAEDVEALRGELAHTLREALGLNCAITLLPPGEGPRSEGGKLSRVVDRR